MEDRFELVSTQVCYHDAEKNQYVGTIEVWRDKQPGVMYANRCRGSEAGSFTVLVDKEGKPVTSFKVNVK